MTAPDRIEAGRRARAALAYSKVRVRQVAADLNVSEMTVHRMLAGSRKETSWDDLWAIADLCGLPREWFSADLDRLIEIVPEGAPRFAQAEPRGEQMLARLLERQLEEAVEQEGKSSAGTAVAARESPRKAQGS